MENKTFHVGLCLAGAVSAGAYTAGVVDYLLEALAKWEERKKNGVPGTPMRNVVIPAIGGASAGGMTGIITAAALSNKIEPVSVPNTAKEIFAERPNNKLYHSWVDLLGAEMFPILLDTSDIKKCEKVPSLINSGFIDSIAEKVVKIDKDQTIPLPPFIANKLKIFTTLTNLEGYQYEISYASNIKKDKYYMTMHNDYACFQLNKDDLVKDGWMLPDFKTERNVITAKDAAMATGAFPVGLQSRVVKREAIDINKNKWFDIFDPVEEGTTYKTQNIDGGTINNEPFEKVRDILVDITGQDDPLVYNDPLFFESTVLLVDPFPSEKRDVFKVDTSLFATIGYTLSSLIGQGRAKPGVVSAATNPKLVGQYMIAPSRKRPNTNGEIEQMEGEKAIACGAFDGFSGFVNKEFRVHDFFLGRHNCEMMLRKYFVVPESALDNNEIFKNGYANVDRSALCVQEDGKENKYPIIPIFDDLPTTPSIPTFSSGTDWPAIPDDMVEKYRPLVKKRVQAILLNIVALNPFIKLLLGIGAKLFINRLLTNGAMDTIKEALVKHGLIKK